MKKILKLWGIHLTDEFSASFVQKDLQSYKGKPKVWLYFNAHAYNLMWSNPDYRQHYLRADRVFPDGIGTHILCKIFCKRNSPDLNGTDMFPDIIKSAEERGNLVFFLGAKKNRVNQFLKHINKKYPRLRVAGHRDGYFSQEEIPEVLEEINKGKTEILFVALGMPTQEDFVYRHLNELKSLKLIVCVGGLFDYGDYGVRRAPVFLQKLELEWAWRLAHEPKRLWRRYILGAFLLLYNIFRLARTLKSK